jgi:putative DNA primase/helicase
VKGTDKAAWNRLHPVPCDIEIPKAEQIKDLDEKLLKEEAEGILAFIVAGAMRWHRRGLSRPDDIDTAKASWQRCSASHSRFYEECCSFRPGQRCSVETMRKRYEKWCGAMGESPLPAAVFNSELTARGAVQPDSAQQYEGKKRRVWLNVGLVGQVEQEQ